MSVEVTGEGWFEAWWDYSSRPPYILILFGGASPENFEIFDPQARTVVHSAPSYEDAVLWLSEDEYTRIDGRTSLDE